MKNEKKPYVRKRSSSSHLDDWHFGHESRAELVEDLGHELRVLEGLPGLHDAHDGGLDEELAVLLDVLVGELHLLLLLSLHRNVDVHAQFLVLVAVEQLQGTT